MLPEEGKLSVAQPRHGVIRAVYDADDAGALGCQRSKVQRGGALINQPSLIENS